MVADSLTRLPAVPMVGPRARVRERVRKRVRKDVNTAALVVGAATIGWIGLFSYLAVVRHLAGGSNAEDLGFTDQVLWNFVRGQWFRMSIYNGAIWNTEMDLSNLARPDSLLAFHVEPMLLALVPLYALGGGPLLLLVIQATAFGLGAVPAFRLGSFFSRTSWGGTAVALAYLLSPFGQSAVLSDFHTSTLAVPLLLLAIERILVARSSIAGLLTASAALSAREDLGPAVALMAVSLLLLGAPRRAILAMAAIGVAWTVLAAAVLYHYSGGISPFAARYGDSVGGGLSAMSAALVRPEVLRSYTALLLGGGWLALLSPVALLGGLPTLAANALSSSPWMASSNAHYGALLLPFSTLAVATALGRVGRRAAPLAAAAVVLTAALAYLAEGSGPLAGNYAPAQLTEHARLATATADSLPADAAVSASSTLVPHLSHRARLYLFPSILDADYVFLDVGATSAPTSPGDVFLRTRDLLAQGGWRLETFTDGLLVLRRDDTAPPQDIQSAAAVSSSVLHEPRLLDAVLVPSPDGATDVDGPRWILRTTWQTDQPLPPGTRLEYWLDLRDNERIHVWDIASLWWNPPARWMPGQAVSVDIPDVPVRRFGGWRSVFTAGP